MSTEMNVGAETNVGQVPAVMAATVAQKPVLPDHTMLPDKDGNFVKNFQEHSQSMLLTETILPVLGERYPDGRYCIGQDSGIYWRLDVEPPERGAEAPDWFLVVGVPPVLNGKSRRSYVMWKEYIAPVIALEFVSGDGSEERDTTELKGKFWIYEQALRIPFYGIYEVEKASIEMYHLVDGRYRPLPINEQGRYVIEPLGVELGIWQGRFANLDSPWMRWWSAEGELLLTGAERAAAAEARAERERLEKEQERIGKEAAQADARLFADKLRELGIDPDTLKK